MTRPWRFPWVALLLAVPALVLVSASPAAAADDLGLSRDGVTWQDDLTTPLFDPARRWVPGDVEMASFFVRNQGPTAAGLTLEARLGGDRPLRDDLLIEANIDDRGWERLDPSSGFALRTGDRAQVDVRVSFDPTSGNATQRLRVPLRFVVVARGDDAAIGPAGDDSGLPDTGSSVGVWLLVVGMLALGVGLSLAAPEARRAAGARGREHPHG